MLAPSRPRDVVRFSPAIVALAMDQVAARVVLRFREAGVRSILLKGPALAGWLYADGSPRAYLDCDLLVAVDDFALAEATLQQLGFEQGVDEQDPPGWQLPAHEWQQPNGAKVDLHRTLTGVGATPARLWSVFSESTVSMPVVRLPSGRIASSLVVRAVSRMRV